MESLSIGDAVRTSNEQFHKVYGFGHYAPSAMAEFLQVYHDGAAREGMPLEVTGDHMVYIHDQKAGTFAPIPASRLRVGDFLVAVPGLASPSSSSSAQVRAIHTVHRRGAYAPFTLTGDIVVNGVVASNYIALPPARFGKAAYETHQWLQHAAYMPYRLFCSVVVDCQHETYDVNGFSKAVSMWLPILRWVERQCPDLLVNALLYVATNPTAFSVAAAVLGFFWARNVCKKRVHVKAL